VKPETDLAPSVQGHDFVRHFDERSWEALPKGESELNYWVVGIDPVERQAIEKSTKFRSMESEYIDTICNDLVKGMSRRVDAN
jgi:hypothetical protein